jgi:hypothetical protein
MELTVLHLLLILIGVIVISTIGYQFVSNINEPFYVVEATPTCPKGTKFAGSSGTCMDSTNPSLKTASAPICPAGSNLNPETNKCKIGAPALPDQYWLPLAERKKSTTATTPAKPATTATATTAAPVPAKPAITSPTCYDPNGNIISLTSLLGLSGAPPPGNAALSTGSSQTALPTCPAGQVYDFVQQLCVPIASTKPICPAGQILDMAQGLCITNIPAIPAFSSTQNIASSKAADSAILQNVEQIVRNELLSQKGMTTGAQMAFLGENKKQGKDYDDTENSENNKNSDNSPSSHQGKEYKRDCAKNMGTRNSANERNMGTRDSASERNTGTRNVPDMSEYIRKDSIPCWGCNVE